MQLMDAEQLGEWSLDLRNKIQQIGAIILPPHATNRLALVMQGQAVELVDVAAVRESELSNSGVISVFTSALLGLIRFVNVPEYQREMDVPTGDIEVQVVPRRSLVRLSIDKAEGNRNYNGAWGSRRPTWPSYGELRLTYSGLAEDVILGQRNLRYSEEVPELGAFMPGFVADLTAAA
jgi:hypothetical protein